MKKVSMFYKKIGELDPVFLAWTENKEYADEFEKFRETLIRIDKDATLDDIQELQLMFFKLEIKPMETITNDDGVIKTIDILATDRERENLSRVIENFNNVLRPGIEIPLGLFKTKISKTINSIYIGRSRLNYKIDELSLFIKMFIKEEYPFNLFSLSEIYRPENWY